MRDNVVFPSAKTPWVGALIWGAVIFIAAACVMILQNEGPEQWMALIMALIAIMLLWMWFRTFYEIDGHNIWYRSGPVYGKIKIAEINSIVVGKEMYSGLRPALGAKGCIIKYRKFDEIYMSPREQDQFVKELVALNPGIKVFYKN